MVKNMLSERCRGWKIWWVKDIVCEHVFGWKLCGWTITVYERYGGLTITVGEIYGGWTIKVGKHVCGLTCMWVKAMLAKKNSNNYSGWTVTVSERYGGWTITVGEHVCGWTCTWVKAIWMKTMLTKKMVGENACDSKHCAVEYPSGWMHLVRSKWGRTGR